MSAEPELVWGDPQGGLRLGLAADGSTAHLHLENVGSESLAVMSYVAGGPERQFDWFTILLDGSGELRRIGFADARDRSAPISANLEPGASLHHAVDIQDWAARPVNGGTPLGHGQHPGSAVYEVARD